MTNVQQGGDSTTTIAGGASVPTQRWLVTGCEMERGQVALPGYRQADTLGSGWYDGGAVAVRTDSSPDRMASQQHQPSPRALVPPIAWRMAAEAAGQAYHSTSVYDALGFHSSLLGQDLIAVRLPKSE
jgi:hypothetical protein